MFWTKDFRQDSINYFQLSVFVICPLTWHRMFHNLQDKWIIFPYIIFYSVNYLPFIHATSNGMDTSSTASQDSMSTQRIILQCVTDQSMNTPITVLNFITDTTVVRFEELEPHADKQLWPKPINTKNNSNINQPFLKTLTPPTLFSSLFFLSLSTSPTPSLSSLFLWSSLLAILKANSPAF